MIGRIVKSLIGLFVDDELLAAGTLIAVAAIAILALLGAAPTGLVGLLLIIAFPVMLAVSVVRSVWRARSRQSEVGSRQ